MKQFSLDIKHMYTKDLFGVIRVVNLKDKYVINCVKLVSLLAHWLSIWLSPSLARSFKPTTERERGKGGVDTHTDGWFWKPLAGQTHPSDKDSGRLGGHGSQGSKVTFFPS